MVPQDATTATKKLTFLDRHSVSLILAGFAKSARAGFARAAGAIDLDAAWTLAKVFLTGAGFASGALDFKSPARTVAFDKGLRRANVKLEASQRPCPRGGRGWGIPPNGRLFHARTQLNLLAQMQAKPGASCALLSL